MTIEEIKKKIEKLNEDAYPRTYDGEWCQGYERGRESAYNDCLELLESIEPTKPSKVYLLEQDDSNGYVHYNGVYTSEYKARKHSIGYDVVEFELNKESDGVIL